MTSTLWAEVSDLPTELQLDVSTALRALEFASEVLFSLTGQMYRPVQQVTEVYDTSNTLAAGTQVYPAFINGTPYNLLRGDFQICSACGILHRTRLRGYPVQSVDAVWLHGNMLSSGQYTLLDNAVLGLFEALGCAAGCLQVLYRYGTGIPVVGRRAAAKLAAELLQADRGGPCMLPERVTSFNRQGVSYTLLDPQNFLNEGRTGIYEIDLAILTMNPAKALRKPRVFSPDLPRPSVAALPGAPSWVVLADTEQAVVPGQQADWISTDQALIDALILGDVPVTQLGSGQVVPGEWVLRRGDGGQKYASLHLEQEHAAQAGSVGRYSVRSRDGTLLTAGAIRKLVPR